MNDMPVFCASCGRPLGGQVAFCAGCGAPVRPPAPGGPPAPPVYAAPPPTALPPQYYAPPPPRKSGCSGCFLAAFLVVLVLLAIGGAALFFFEDAIRKALNAEDRGSSRSSDSSDGGENSFPDDIQEDQVHLDESDGSPLLGSGSSTAELPPTAKGRGSALTGEIVYKCTSSSLYLTVKFSEGKVSATCAMRDGKHRREFSGTLSTTEGSHDRLEGSGTFSGEGKGTADYRFSSDGASAEVLWKADGASGQQWTKWVRVDSVGADEFGEGK